MTTATSFSPRELLARLADALNTWVSLIVFVFLDLLDFLLCFVYRFLDGILEGKPSTCHCRSRGHDEHGVEEEVVEDGISDTLYGRKNIFREMGIFGLKERMDEKREKEKSASPSPSPSPRSSDCGCARCLEWQGKRDKLHFVVHEPTQLGNGSGTKPVENVIFIHGLLSSSSMWMETVIPNVSEAARPNLRMFALDLLGFGRSPKPTDCMYTLKEHLQMIEDSIIAPYQLSSFHLVAHSMGCIMALALAAKYPDSVKSVTIVAPNASHTVLNRLAERKVWPPLLFGASVMSWYEHLCRTICYVVCRNHLKWDWIPKLLANKSETCNFMKGIHEHTHRSAFHTMHNVLCAGAKLLDGFLEVVSRSGTPLTIIQGDRDTVVPPDCSYNVKLKVPHARLQVIGGADHRSVISDRKKIFAEELEDIWLSSSKCNRARQIRCQLDA